MTWLLGDDVHVATSHFAFSYSHSEITWTKKYPEHFSVDAEYLEYVSGLRGYGFPSQFHLSPAALVRLDKTSDNNEGWSHVDFCLLKSSIHSPNSLLLNARAELPTSSVEVDIPQVIIKSREVAEKVRRDYPEAASALRKLIKDCVDLAVCGSQDSSHAEILANIRKEVLVPGVEQIKHERRRLLKSHAVSAAVDSVGISIPLVLAHAPNVDAVISSLLAAGLGAVAARELNRLRDDLAGLRKTAFYAALQLGI
jgi:hypothetical protein